MKSVFKDPRDFQILFLAVFLPLGVWGRDWTLRLDLMVAMIASCLLSQIVANLLEKRMGGPGQSPSVRSAWITAISLCLLLRANSVFTVILAGVASIFSKLLFRYRKKHFFNPSNFGIILVLLLTQDAWVSPGQWGNDLWYLLLIAATGGMICRKVGRWDTSGAFLGFYALMEAIRNAWLGWTPDVFFHKLSSGSLLLFAFFMITDPRAIPDHRKARVLWAFCVAALTFVLRNQYFIPTAPFWALFVLSPLTILFDILLPAKRFQWKPETEPTKVSSKLPIEMKEVLP